MSRGGADARGLPGKAGPGPPLPCPRPRPPSRPAGPTDDMGWRRPQAAYWVVSAPSWLGPPCGPGVSDRPGRGCGGWGRRRCRPRGQLDTPQPASLSSRSGHAHACHRDRPGHGASCPGTPHRGSGRPLGPQDGPVPGDGSGGGPPRAQSPPVSAVVLGPPRRPSILHPRVPSDGHLRGDPVRAGSLGRRRPPVLTPWAPTLQDSRPWPGRRGGPAAGPGPRSAGRRPPWGELSSGQRPHARGSGRASGPPGSAPQGPRFLLPLSAAL